MGHVTLTTLIKE